jgi:hypothetical protein
MSHKSGDVEYRQERVKNVGLGFELPPSPVQVREPQIVEGIVAA